MSFLHPARRPPSPALARARLSCVDATKLANNYRAVGDYFAAAVSPSAASYYYAQANLILGESC
jgi:hypothetical protein